MVHSRASLAALVLAFLLPAYSPTAHASISDYRIGDIVREDIFPPASPSGEPARDTASDSQPRGQRLYAAPLVLRFNPKSPDEAEVSLRAAIIMARYHFLRVFQEQLLGRTPTEADLGSPAYTRAVAEVSRNVPAHFPFDQLSPLWVRGESEETLILTLAQPIRQAMANIIVDDATSTTLPPEKSLRLVIVKNLAMPLGVRDLDGPGLIISPSKTIRLTQARELVENNFPAAQPGLARFAATFVRANTQLDSFATTLLENRPHPAPTTVTSSHPGQALLRKGQIIDRQALETLTALREKSPAPALAQPSPITSSPPETRGQRLHATTAPSSPTPPLGPRLYAADWTLIATFGAALLALAGFYGFKRARKSTTPDRQSSRRAAPRPTPREEQLIVLDDTPDSNWRDHALFPRSHASHAPEATRPGALARMKEKFVGTLFRHRAELLAAQQKAQADMEQLERRLEQLHAPLQQRIQAYEKRIAELEQKLANKGEENRHLLGASITLARQQLERRRFDLRR
ncbi:hypothetical protein CMV30_04195 [Nibricoccus aquaticus]|uniref:Metal-dependent phosphohydrolase 7TM extracellular domain-containing protein n=1 Tax=Nibricoccus aquaticus TaxID=2576891 RepID=A0A290QAF3_9BACT|nr:hypothetical protein [Nibricoccus aquaticus]ATC63216.1 hypothetical protein CMV30_04195 [Nibricoccus aquaticus]